MPRTAPRYTHWTDDTETAFIMALRFHGHVVRAITEIGRSVDSAYKRRRNKPDFAARWQSALDENEAKRAAEKKPHDEDEGLPNRVRFDGWTALRQRAFFRGLTKTGNVQQACKLAGISDESAHRMCRRYPSFAVAWDRALAKSEPTLEQVAVDRAVNGVAEPVYHGGAVVGHRTRYSDSLMRDVLKREDARLGAHKTTGDLVTEARAAARLAGGSFHYPPSQAEVDAILLARLDALAARQRRQARDEAVRLLAAGLVP